MPCCGSGKCALGVVCGALLGCTCLSRAIWHPGVVCAYLRLPSGAPPQAPRVARSSAPERPTTVAPLWGNSRRVCLYMAPAIVSIAMGRGLAVVHCGLVRDLATPKPQLATFVHLPNPRRGFIGHWQVLFPSCDVVCERDQPHAREWYRC